jgi:hypothetical protein
MTWPTRTQRLGLVVLLTLLVTLAIARAVAL